MPLYHSKLSLYCIPHYSAESAIVAQQTIAVLHTTLFSRQCHCSTANYLCTAHHIIQQTVPLYQSKLSLYSTPHYSIDSANVADQSIAVRHTTLFSRQCHCNKAIYRCTVQQIIHTQCHSSTANYRCTAHRIIQQTVPM